MKYRNILISILWMLTLGLSAQTADMVLSNGLRVTDRHVSTADSILTISMNFVLDKMQMRPNGMHAYTPVITAADGTEHYLPALLITGRRQHFIQLRQPNAHYPDAAEVWRKNGTAQSYHYIHSMRMALWMRNAEVRLIEDSCGCGIALAQNVLDPVGTLRHEVDVTGLLQSVCASCIRPTVRQETKTYALEGRAFLDFRVNKTDIDAAYRNNPTELQKIMRTIDIVRTDTNATITGISIHGYASPEGKYSHNVYLAEHRALALKDYVRRLRHFDESLFTVRSTPEDWAGLDSLLRTSTLPEREAILALVRTDMDPDRRNDEIQRRWPETYRTVILKEWYPALRHSDYVVNYTVREFTTPEEALRVYREKPYQLSLPELYMVASLYDEGSRAYNDVLMQAAKLHPDNAEANLNAAIICLNRRDLNAAEGYLAKAGHSPEAQHARGMHALLSGDYDKARPLLEAATTAGIPHAAENLRILRDITGQ